MRLRVVVDGTLLAATLDDSEVARDFASLLPLDLQVEDYASTEKIAYLPRKLSTGGAPRGASASAGDIMYYAPWGNLAFFYRDSGHATGLVRLGSLDDGVELLERPGTRRVIIERNED